MQLFNHENYETAAQKTINALYVAQKHENFRDDPEYNHAVEALSLMNSIEAGAYNSVALQAKEKDEFVIYASANKKMQQWHLLNATTPVFHEIQAVKPDVVLMRDFRGDWTDLTPHFQ